MVVNFHYTVCFLSESSSAAKAGLSRSDVLLLLHTGWRRIPGYSRIACLREKLCNNNNSGSRSRTDGKPSRLVYLSITKANHQKRFHGQTSRFKGPDRRSHSFTRKLPKVGNLIYYHCGSDHDISSNIHLHRKGAFRWEFVCLTFWILLLTRRQIYPSWEKMVRSD